MHCEFFVGTATTSVLCEFCAHEICWA